MVMRRRRLEWFRHRDERENTRAVVEGRHPRERPNLRWKYTVRRNIGEEWATDMERWKGRKTRYSSQGDGGERKKNIIQQYVLQFTNVAGKQAREENDQERYREANKES